MNLVCTSHVLPRRMRRGLQRRGIFKTPGVGIGVGARASYAGAV